MLFKIGRLVALLCLFGGLIGASDARHICPILCGKSSGNNGPVIQPLRSAVSRALVGQSFVSMPAGFVQSQTRIRMYLGGAPLTEISVCYGNWAGDGELSGPGNLVVEAALESDGPLGVQLFTWSGNANVTIAPGATACSDPVFPAAFGLTVFPASSAMWFRTGAIATTNQGTPFGNLMGLIGEGSWGGASFTSQVNATGAMTTPAGGSTVTGAMTPFAVLGRYTVPMPTLCAIGDSINEGVNDIGAGNPAYDVGGYAGGGYVGRAGYNTYGTQIYPIFRLAIGGDQASNSTSHRAAFYQYCTHALTAWGVNDIEAVSAAVVFNNFKTIWAAMKAAGIQYIFQATVTPKATSTDQWATLANQTPIDANFVLGGPKDQLNALIVGSVGANNLTNYVDVASVAQAPSNVSLWNVNGTALFATGDGLHPQAVIHALAAPLLLTAIKSVGPQLPSVDTSWVPAGADWAMDFKNGRYYQINCPATICVLKTNNVGNDRASVGYGVTANDSSGKLIQFEPTTQRIVPGRGLLAEKTTINLAANPFAPASQPITVSNATQYTASITGPGSMALSGACAGSVTAGSPVTCTTSSTTLTTTVSGAPSSMQVELGAEATSPINGTRAAENVGFSGPKWLQTTAGTLVVTVEGVPNNKYILGAFGGFINQVTTTTINNSFTASLTATFGAAANGHTVDGLTWDATGRGLDGNAGTIATDANGNGFVSQAYIGGQGVGSVLDTYVQMITHYPGRLTGATTPTFQQATTP